MQAAILCYWRAAFGPRTPPFLVDKLETFPQLISNEVSDCIIFNPQLLGSTQFFCPYRGFLLITLPPGMLYFIFFQDLKNHRFLDVCAKFLAYLSYLFNFKIGSLLGLSCLMSSMFIIILIIRIIKITCFDNIILKAELKGKLP